MIEGCGKAFNEHITQNLLDLIFQALNHTNRFVRETGYQLCASLVRLGRKQGRIQKFCEMQKIIRFVRIPFTQIEVTEFKRKTEFFKTSLFST